MNMTLRKYQEEAKTAVFEEWDKGFKKTLLVLPTGTGKTIVFSAVTEDIVRRGGRVLILAHRAELLDQAADKLEKATGLKCGVEKAEQTSIGTWYRAIVGSVQTMMREKRLASFSEDYFSHIIIDEAHHVISDSYQKILKHFKNAHVLGVTATPDRGDMKNLGTVFESLAYEYSITQAIKEGYLTPIKAMTIPLKLDLTGVHTQAGDYKTADLDIALEPYLEQIADEMKRYCMTRKTVVFLPLIKTSQHFRDILIERGFRAAEVNGNSEDRAEILTDFEAGKYNVLCNSMLLTEGWDCPSVDCVVVLRPTKVRGLYCQMVGRGTRPCKGKKDLLILDFLWHTQKLELCRPACLISSTEEESKAITKRLEDNAGQAQDIEETMTAAQKDTIAEREASLAKQLEECKKRKRQLVDPLQFEMSICAEDLAGYVPSFGWEMLPPTEKQVKALEKAGIYPDEIDNAGKASLLLNKISKRRLAGLSTPKQIRCLEKYGFMHVGEWEFSEASNMIGRLAANRWRVPRDIDVKTYTPKSNERNEQDWITW